MNIIILSDYFKNSGLGNYLRSQYLYSYLKKKKQISIDFHILSNTKKNDKKYNIIIFDLPIYNYDIKSIVSKFAKKKFKIIALDYIFKYKIDCNISIYKKSNFAKKNFVGLEYSIIRKEFINKKIKINKNLFFISIGSSDILNIKKKIKKVFSKHFSTIFTNSNLKKKKNFSSQENYIKKMASCKMAASNGGTTMLELLFLKKTVFVYPQNHFELKFSKYVKKKGFPIFINKFNINKKEIFDNKNKKNLLIDQFGVDRICNIIRAYLNNN